MYSSMGEVFQIPLLFVQYYNPTSDVYLSAKKQEAIRVYLQEVGNTPICQKQKQGCSYPICSMKFCRDLYIRVSVYSLTILLRQDWRISWLEEMSRWKWPIT